MIKGLDRVLLTVGRRQGEQTIEQVQSALCSAPRVRDRGAALLALGFALGSGLIRKSQASGALSVTQDGRRVGRRSCGVDVLGESCLSLEDYLTDHEIAVRHDVTTSAVRAARQRASERASASQVRPKLELVKRGGG